MQPILTICCNTLVNNYDALFRKHFTLQVEIFRLTEYILPWIVYWHVVGEESVRTLTFSLHEMLLLNGTNIMCCTYGQGLENSSLAAEADQGN